MQEGIDLVRYGVLWQKVESYEAKFDEISKKQDKMEAQLEQLIANSNKQQGMAWLGIGMLTALSTIGGWLIHWWTGK
jgi:uncharacterized phage infection (PIP) family protein YhgE